VSFTQRQNAISDSAQASSLRLAIPRSTSFASHEVWFALEHLREVWFGSMLLKKSQTARRQFACCKKI